MLDQTFINDRMLSQLDAISKRLNVIESSSASASVNKLHAAPRGTKRPVKTANSNLKLSVDSSVKNSDVNLPDLKSIIQDRYIQKQVEERIRQLSGLANKGTATKIKSLRGGGGGMLTCTSNNASNGHMFWLAITKIESHSIS